MRSVTKVWPQARLATSSVRLADGASYAPAWYLSADASIGTAPTPDGAALRLLLRAAGGARELRRLDANGAPQFAAVTSDDHAVYWAESVATETGGGAVSTRTRPGAFATASAPDVALLDRFEVLTTGTGASHTVQLFDEKTRTTAAVATNAGTVVARGGALWWSTATEWHVLDLTSLRRTGPSRTA